MSPHFQQIAEATHGSGGSAADLSAGPTVGYRLLFAVAVFVALAAAILSQPTKRLNDFDQSFYLTIAYDLDRHRTFSNGIFDSVDSTRASPPPGLFFGPLYPVIIVAAMKVDARFAAAVECAVDSNHGRRDGADCDVYARPMHLLHAALLTLAVIAAATAAVLIFAAPGVFYLTGLLATAALMTEAGLFSYIMTESLTIAVYSLATLALVFAWRTGRPIAWAATGALFGLLMLTRPSFMLLAPLAAAMIVPGRRAARLPGPAWPALLVFCLALAVVVGPWLLRNTVSVGKLALTEEYGSVALIERFAYNSMTLREFALSVPYCVPVVGPAAVDAAFAPGAMRRFDWSKPDGFFDTGRRARIALIAEHGKLDPVIKGLVATELRQNGWRYLLTSVPLAWCGLWVGQIVALLLIPMFGVACVQAVRHWQPLFLLYAAPAILMLGLHAAVANHYTRYNLILIGPAAVGAAWVLSRLLAAYARARRAPAL